MWLYQYPDCRTIKDSSYVDPDARNNYLQRLGRRGLGHDLLKIIEVVRSIPEYRWNENALQFLNLSSGLSGDFTIPHTTATNKLDGRTAVIQNESMMTSRAKPTLIILKPIHVPIGSRNFFCECDPTSDTSGRNSYVAVERIGVRASYRRSFRSFERRAAWDLESNRWERKPVDFSTGDHVTSDEHEDFTASECPGLCRSSAREIR